MVRFGKIVVARVTIGLLIIPMSVILLVGMAAESITKFVEKSMTWYKETMINLRVWSED